jgi:SAM-dependent methyltransferase
VGASGGVPGRLEVPTGNTYDKYGSANPLVQRLMRVFEANLDELLRCVRPQSILDVGCGEGVLTERWADRLPTARVVGLDLDDGELRAQWERRRRSNLEFAVGEASALGYADGEFELVSAIEMLEHVHDVEATLAELARVASRALLVSAPREPLWRFLNIARGAYWPSLGNTPGHVNHWSKRRLVSLLARFGEIEAVRSPLPWTMVLVHAPSSGKGADPHG